MKIFKVDILFTFHNVSINSGSEGYKDIIDTHLHSTMFLLIRLVAVYFLNCTKIYIPQCFY